jgi:hypothetical protein
MDWDYHNQPQGQESGQNQQEEEIHSALMGRLSAVWFDTAFI